MQNIDLSQLLNGNTSTVTLSTFENQLLVDISESSDLYIYSTTNHIYTLMYNITKLLPSGQTRQRQRYTDIAMVSDSSLVYTADNAVTVLDIPSLERTTETLAVTANHRPRFVSVANNSVIYVALEKSGVYRSVSKGGQAWALFIHMAPSDDWMTLQAINVPTPINSRSMWTLEADGLRRRVCIYDEDKEPKVTVVFNTTFPSTSNANSWRDEYFLKLAYDGRNNVIMADHYRKTVHVFKITGDYRGHLNVIGVEKAISPRSIALDVNNQLLYLGMDEGYVMVLDLTCMD